MSSTTTTTQHHAPTATKIFSNPAVKEPLTPPEDEAPIIVFDPSSDAKEYTKNGQTDDLLANYAIPRANVAATREAPMGTTKDQHNVKHRKQTVLEQHCVWFDKDGDGVIWPTDTFRTCREFGWGIRLSLFFCVFLHMVQSWGTVPWFFLIPDPLFRVWIKNIHFNKHGSSTMAFDNDGNFRPQYFDEFFAKFDTDGKGGLTFQEGWTALRRIHMAWDIFGQISAMFEWGMTYVLLWPDDGVVRKEDARRVLDGSIFHEMTMKPRKSKAAKAQ